MSNDDAVQRDSSPHGVGRSPGSGGAAGPGASDVFAEEADPRRRASRLERVLVSIGCLGAALLLVLGSVLPMYTDHYPFGSEEAWSVGSTAGWGVTMLFGGERLPTDSPGVQAVFFGGFVGLAIIVVAILLVVLPMAAAGQLAGRRRCFSLIVVLLGMVGSVVPVLLSLVAIGSESSGAGWGGPVLCAGMLAALVVVVVSARTRTESGR